MLKISKFYQNYNRLRKDFRYRISDIRNPVFSWAAVSGKDGAYQSAYRITVKAKDRLLWDSGKVDSKTQSAAYAGLPLPPGEKLEIGALVWDNDGEAGESYKDYFYSGAMNWEADWIAHPKDAGGQNKTARKVLIFKKEAEISDGLESACLFVCGLGYHKVRINGILADPSELDPAHSDYSETAYYAVLPEISEMLHRGQNEIKICVADGWRNIDSGLVDRHTGGRGVRFGGIKLLSAVLSLRYKDGRTENIKTGPDWQVCADPCLESNIYDGETLDMTKSGAEVYQNAQTAAAPCKKMRAQALPPIRPMQNYRAKSLYSPEAGVYVADFGQNIAGVAELRLPDNLEKGQKITIKFAEVKNPDGSVNQKPLREAKCADVYIAAGGDRDQKVWQPQFTYHGFRYAQIEGLDLVGREDITAVSLYTDLDNDSFFECGDPLVNQIHKNAVMTERANMHSVLTDCPQRDERMGWMNDATVRFEATPYNFDIGQMFAKVVRDIAEAQSEDGAITCTAPYVFGSRPADPVCSSFLVAGLMDLLHAGNAGLIGEAYENFKAWENCLLEKSEGYITNYSHYGDWAGPAYACDRPQGAVSAVTPGLLMSTGYSYYNCRLIEKFAKLLNNDSDAEKYAGIAEKIKEAFLEKWFDEKSGIVASGSQASHAFALWLGLIPKEHEQRVAELMVSDLVQNDYRFTTGNLCTRYLFDMLARYGYENEAWELITRQTYPSYGYMIQNEATTIWERFELKLDPGMNSHNHPMYGAVDYWLYAYIAGIRPLSPGFEEFAVEPCYPKKLLSASAVADTVRGDISVRWIRQYGELWLYVSVPFGSAANIKTAGGYIRAGSGSHRFLIEEEKEENV
ncbi:MAG: glycoside hydrolase family 78 protein [Oscillospiraceae bacterium]|nr:glycoside hydrolase family 78 protein [Oscillospiraceae bacterium]